MARKKHQMVRKIYRECDIVKYDTEIEMLGNEAKFDSITFLNIRLLTTMIVFLLVLYNTKVGYIYAPFVSILYYYLFHYFLLSRPLKKRTKRLDHQALYFFEIFLSLSISLFHSSIVNSMVGSTLISGLSPVNLNTLS